MRHAGLLAFGITTAVLVPAALHQLDAGAVQVGHLAAPGARSLALRGATIDVAADRAIIDAGGKVAVTLTARQASAEKVTVAVVVMESVGSDGGRVETPPRPVARELVTFAPGATGERHALAFTLRGYRGMEMDGKAPFGHYAILVMEPKAAAKLERLRKRAAREANPMEDPDNRYGAWIEAYSALDRDADGGDDGDDGDDAEVGAAHQTARLDVYTRATGGPVALTVPDTATVGQPYTVVVTVKNPGKRRVAGLGVGLQRPPLYGLEYRGLEDEQLTITPASATVDLGPRESKQVTFTVTASAVGTAGLYARTSCDDVDSEGGWAACQPVLDGALDATDIVAAEPAGGATTIAQAAR